MLREEWARRITEAELLTAMTPEELFSEATAVYDNYVEVLETGSVEALQAYVRDLSERIIPRGVETDEVVGIVLLLRDVLARAAVREVPTEFGMLNRVLTPTNPRPTASPTRWPSASCRNASASSASSRRRSASCRRRCCRCASSRPFCRSSVSSTVSAPGRSPNSCCAPFGRTARKSSSSTSPCADHRLHSGANHLVQTVDASGLMGASVIITGLSSEIARRW